MVTLLSLFMATTLSAQYTGIIRDGFNVEKFPEVSFIYHSDDPDILDDGESWTLTENGVKKQIIHERLSNDDAILPLSVLVLWEDMAYNGRGQFDFTRDVLSGFFIDEAVKSSDRFAIYSFNRRKNTSPVLRQITPGFTRDRDMLVSAIRNYQPSRELYKDYPNRSDMYSAVREGLDILAPESNAKAIIVFTSGYHMDNSGSDSEAQVLLKSQQLHIPVYIFQYYFKSGVTPASEGFAKSTYGTFKPYKDAKAAKAGLAELYPEISKRYSGQDYLVTYSSGVRRGSTVQTVELSVGSKEIQGQMMPPSHNFKSWTAAHPWLTALLILLLLTLIAGTILYTVLSKKRASENRRRIEELVKIQNEGKEAAEQYIQENQQRIERQENEAETARLERLMVAKNMFPRLKYSLHGNTYTYEIVRPVITIGREDDNNLILPINTVSRHHAEISFNGNSFEIADRQSTNKVIVNGQFTERATLNSGDLIGLGEIVLTFYM